MHRWVAGAYIEGRDRDVDVRGTGYEMKYNRVMGYLGFDIFSWITAYVTAGANSSRIGGDAFDYEGAPEFGGGFNFNLIDHEVLDPTLFEDRLRLNASVALIVGGSEPDVIGDVIQWEELSASVILSVVNDCEGEKFYTPNSVVIFGGAILSELFGDDIGPDDLLGATAGLEVFYTKSVSFTAGVEFFGGNPGYVGGIHLRF